MLTTRGGMVKRLICILGASFLLNACAPKVGSPEWCDAMNKKAKGDWSMNEAKDYAKHCIFK